MTERQPNFKAVTLRERPELEQIFSPQKDRIWPQFMFYDVYAAKRWRFLSNAFSSFQVYLLNEADEPIAVGQAIPCVWDGTMNDLPIGWADSLVRGVDGYEAGRQPNTLAALEIAIQPEYRGQGVSYEMLTALRTVAKGHGFQAIIVAVRPSMKSHYPITPMERYARWQREDGTPFDPWLRAHWRCGAEILKTAHPSMVIEAGIDQWEAWTGLKFPESGDYVIPEALAPIQIDRTMDMGRYVEPNIWVHHPITTKRLTEPKE